ncbi:hypothetical protein CQY20_22370 [Mycolicibacterium agri]|uniref:SH3 domain-containing protein n=1 Tax=Mycolicibacterium agri TaxID=36811 RepID=A0A2A7MUA8_MYCAG|nr:hypothetical protein [Mycolicibacterium agri]PEG35315.1 hypothetical protein CQY20_22370 [Mycolicibacterium agri]GFG51008.1 hypothetical protein MAGR_24490 [Mycolicibacterium agri]
MSKKNSTWQATLIAATTTCSTMGLVAVAAPAQAIPLFPLAPACNAWAFPGDVLIREGGTGWNVAFSSTGHTASGRATASHESGQSKSGNISGGFTGSHVDLTVRYDNGETQRYIGDVDTNDNNKLAGKTANNVFWRTVFPISCAEVVPPANPGAPSKTAFVTTPPEYDEVDVYDTPGGTGNVIGTIAKDKGVQANADCKPDDWCLIRGVAVPGGQGWMWGHLRFE